MTSGNKQLLTLHVEKCMIFVHRFVATFLVQVSCPVLCTQHSFHFRRQVGRLNAFKGRIQVFPTGAPTQKGEGANPIIWPNFPKNCMNLKKIRPRWGGRQNFLPYRFATAFEVSNWFVKKYVNLCILCLTCGALWVVLKVLMIAIS